MRDTKLLRMIIPLAILLIIAIGFGTSGGIGTLSALGWRDVSLLCPLGALSTMLASKLVLPRAVISLVTAIILVLLFGRAFCAWICPVPMMSKLHDAFAGTRTQNNHDAEQTAGTNSAKAPVAVDSEGNTSSATEMLEPSHGGQAPVKLTDEEKQILATCTAGRKGHSHLDARHFVLGGSLISAAIFGFPVFCLICPIGLSFAMVLLLIRAFGFGDPSWTLVIVTVLLLAEVVFFRKWCRTFCPVSALMSLVAHGNKTLHPTIDDGICLETRHGIKCGRCSQACPEGIDPRHPVLGRDYNECTRCRACLEACPTHALSIPFVATSSQKHDADGKDVAKESVFEETDHG